MSELKGLYDHMMTVLENINNDSFLISVRYCGDDRDSGYRSALRFLGINQSWRTDVIANAVIYHRGETLSADFFEQLKEPAQIGLF